MKRDELVKELERLKSVMSGDAGEKLIEHNENMLYGIWINLFLKYIKRKKTLSCTDLKLFFDVYPCFEKSFREFYCFNTEEKIVDEIRINGRIIKVKY